MEIKYHEEGRVPFLIHTKGPCGWAVSVQWPRVETAPQVLIGTDFVEERGKYCVIESCK